MRDSYAYACSSSVSPAVHLRSPPLLRPFPSFSSPPPAPRSGDRDTRRSRGLAFSSQVLAAELVHSRPRRHPDRSRSSPPASSASVRPSAGGGAGSTSGLAASPLLLVGGGSLWNTLTAAVGAVSMQSYWAALFRNAAMEKREMHSLCSDYAHIFDLSPENTSLGCYIAPNLGRLPVLLKRSVLLTGSAILTIAIRYRALLDRWILQKCAVTQGAPVQSTMMLRSCWQDRSLPLFVGIGVLMARFCSYITIQSHNNNRQVIHGIEANLQGDSVIESNELCNRQSVLPSLLGSKHDYVRLLLHFICSTAIFKAPKVLSFKGRGIQKNYDINALWSIVARNGQYLTYIGALVTLQIFLQINRVNTTTSLLPMLFQTTSSRSKAAVFSKMVIILINSCGILGSAFTTKHHGRAATLTVSIVLMVFCQMAIPSIVEFHMGLGGGSRMPRMYTTAMFLLTCVVSCGLSWSWGSMFWTIPGKKVHSAGQLLGMALNFALCFAQMQYFLMMLWRLKNAILAYYAMWIWS